MEKLPETDHLKHRNAYLLSGFIVSNLVGFFIMGFFLPAFWKVSIHDAEVALVFIGTITLATLISSIASYFWSMGEIPLKSIRALAIPNASGIWYLYIMHSEFNQYLFFPIFAAIIVIFCAYLGTWFGRRFFYE